MKEEMQQEFKNASDVLLSAQEKVKNLEATRELCE